MTANDQSETNKVLFSNLVMMLSTSAMQQLGKLVNPATGKAEVNLEAAQFTIDMLSMIKEKTKGNLDGDEDNLLTHVLSTLQMDYVEVARSAPPAAAPGAEPPAASEPPSSPGQPAEEKKDPKYRKSYGA